MRTRNRSYAALILGLALALGACSSNSPAPSYDNPFDPRNGQGLPIPDSLAVTVGNNLVQLFWGLPENETAEEFAVFRQRLDVDEAEELLARVHPRSYTDSGVRNGRTYAYRLAAGRDGRFGARSEPIEARPGVFSIVIADDAPKTRSRTVSVALSAPAADVVRLVEDPDSVAVTPWRRAAATLNWTLSSGDGNKTLYCVFRLPDGSESLPVSDAIVLDTRAIIRSVGFDGSDVRQPGETVHFFLDAEENDGTAFADVAGLARVSLFDDGSGGDPVPDDGKYEADFVLPVGRAVTAASVTGLFTDDVGNTAESLLGPKTLTVRQSPEPVSMIDPATLAEPPAAAAVTLRWTQALATEFSAYQIFRSEIMPVDSTSRLLGSISGRTTTQYTDSDVVEGRRYFYRVFVLSIAGLQQGSENTLAVCVANERPPQTINLEAASGIATTSLSLRWSRSSDRDFASYRVYRNETGTVTDQDSLLAQIVDVNQNYWDDRDLEENTTYYYRVYVDDLGSACDASAALETRSNEIEATTKNEPPADVELFEATEVTSIAATLSWSASDDRSFALYRLYRDQEQPVNTESTLVVELDDRDTTSYRDTEIDPGMIYHYRIYVVDEDGALSKGSNTIEVNTPN